jgi:hypothetical protein
MFSLRLSISGDEKVYQKIGYTLRLHMMVEGPPKIINFEKKL